MGGDATGSGTRAEGGTATGPGRDNRSAMHLLIPFAAPLSDAGRAAAAGLALPNLQRVLARWREAERDEGDAWSLSPPHERALARALGWQGAAGCLPWAARAAAADGLVGIHEQGDLAWGLLTPAHWHVGTEQVSLADPEALQLEAATSRTLFDAVQPLFTSEGFALHWGAPLRWYAAHESLAGLPTASPDRVIGRNVDAWLGAGEGETLAALRRVRRLHSEVQMLLHDHPANDARAVQGLLPVNSFWLSGCGVAQASAAPEPEVEDRLRAPALADDWPAWIAAWRVIDADALPRLFDAAARGPARLTLAGERSWVAFEPDTRNAWHRLRALLEAAPSLPRLLETL